MSETPSPNGANGGRGAGGRFARGNAGGPGNPYAAKVAELRKAALEAVTATDMREVVAALLVKAKTGDVPAVRELMERTLGKVQEADLMERLEQLEQALAKENPNER